MTEVKYLLTASVFFFSSWQNFVYAVGGNDGVASLSSVERYNPHLNKWTEVCEMGQRRAGNGVSKLNGCLYVVGEEIKKEQKKKKHIRKLVFVKLNLILFPQKFCTNIYIDRERESHKEYL